MELKNPDITGTCRPRWYTDPQKYLDLFLDKIKPDQTPDQTRPRPDPRRREDQDQTRQDQTPDHTEEDQARREDQATSYDLAMVLICSLIP